MRKVRFSGNLNDSCMSDVRPNSVKHRLTFKKTSVRPAGKGAVCESVSKQRKIYDVWPEVTPRDTIPYEAAEEFSCSGNKINYDLLGLQMRSTGHFKNMPDKNHYNHSGTSGAVSFSPYGQSSSNMSVQNTVPPFPFMQNNWWPNNITPYHRQPSVNAEGFGYGEMPNMFQLYQRHPYAGTPHALQNVKYGYGQTNNKLRTPASKPLSSKTDVKSFALKKPLPNTSSATPQKNSSLDDTKKTSNEKTKPKKIFVATNVRGLQAWSEVKGETVVIYEVIGTLDSQITTERYCKSFLLKDGQGHRANCEFFETDRPLIKTCRGKMYRCVGDFNARRGIFHAVCVRAADEKDVRLYRKLVAIANATLKNIRENALRKSKESNQCSK